MRRSGRELAASAAWVALGVLGGLVVALVVTLNVHIMAGLEQGYAATPAEVFDRSVVLGVLDVLLAVGLAAAGALAATWVHAQIRHHTRIRPR